MLLGTCRLAPITWHLSPGTCRLVRVACHQSHDPCRLSPVAWQAPVAWHLRIRREGEEEGSRGRYCETIAIVVAAILRKKRVVTAVLPFVLSASVKEFATCSTACVVSGLSRAQLHIVFLCWYVILTHIQAGSPQDSWEWLAARETGSPVA